MDDFDLALLAHLPTTPALPISIGELTDRVAQNLTDVTKSRTLEQKIRRRLEKLSELYKDSIIIDYQPRRVLYSKTRDSTRENVVVLQQFAMLRKQVARYLPASQQEHLQHVRLNPHTQTLKEWQEKLYLAPSSVWRAPAINPVIALVVYRAIESNVPICFDYTSVKGELSHKKLMPWGLMFKSEKVYVLGVETHLSTDKPAAYALHRMKNPDVLPYSVNLPTKPDNQTITEICERYDIGIFSSKNDQLINLEVKFYNDAARHIDDTPLSPDQQLIELTHDCRLLKATVRDCYELRKFIRGFGLNAEVLAPTYLRQELQQELALLLHRYMKSEHNALLV